jgi:formiminotetrahydrofolate cyclodeaminase
MVGRILLASVVAKMNFTCGGGSSRVLSSALKAALESMWTSSM